VSPLKRKAKDVPAAASQKKQVQESSTLLPGILAALAGLLGAGVLLWFFELLPAQQMQRQALTNAWAESQAGALRQGLAAMRQDIQELAQASGTVSALQSGDAHGITTLEQQLNRLPAIVSVQVFPRGKAAQDLDNPAPINYAALDLIRRAENGEQPPAEAYRVNNRWLVYSAAAIRTPGENSSVVGTVVVAKELTALLRTLPQLPTGTGQVELEQRFGSSPAQSLARLGSGATDGKVELATSNPNWYMVFRPGVALSAPTVPAWLIVSGLLALCGALLGLKLSQRAQNEKLKQDAALLDRAVLELSAGRTIKLPGLSLPPLDTVAQHLVGLSRLNVQAAPAEELEKPINNPPQSASSVAMPRSDASVRVGEVDPLDVDFLDMDFLDEDQHLAGLDTQERDPAMSTVQAPNLPASIFRAYDIRGVVGESLTAETAYWIGRAIGSESLAKGEPNVSVGRDGRLSGPELVQGLIQGIAETGCTVSDVGMVPTPVLYYAANILAGKSGVMLTGSHNPPNYNGFKIVIAGDTLANEQIQVLRERIENGDVASGAGRVEQVDVLQRYFEQIRSDIVLAKKLKVVVDCGNGVAGVIAPQLIEALGCEVVPLFCDVDGNFPNHHPDPGKPENLEDLIAKVKETGADLGLAFDGDGDRVGVVTNKGTIIYPDRLLMLFAKDVVSRNPGSDIIYDVKCTRRLTALISGYGGRPVMYKTGHSLIKKKMKETGALLAGEMSGHVFFKERWYGFDDGIYSAARLLEILSQDSRDAEMVFAAFPNDVATPEINITVTEESKFEIIDALRSDAQWGDANLVTIDGVRVDYPKGWGLVRASNTTPVLVLRFEAETEAELERIKDVFRKQLYNVAPDLNIPF
jgi:phosphomannomutase/phosphoglucomutase